MSGLGGGNGSGRVPKLLDDERTFRADMLMAPSPDWPIPAGADAIEDVSNVTPIVKVFPDYEETGVGFSVFIPKKAAAMQLRLSARAGVSPVSDVQAKTLIRLYAKHDGGWSGASALGFANMPGSQEIVDVEFVVNLRAMKVRPEKFTMFELTRTPRSNALKGTLLLHGVGVSFVSG